MDKLWAPWREKYVVKDIKSQKGDLFEKIQKSKDDKKNFVVIRTKHAYAVMNIYPYNNGHMLIVPNRKVARLKDLKRDEKIGLWDLLEETQDLLQEVLHPDGFNIGLNIGRQAGAGVPEHLHIHLVPRWKGDVNFMPVTADTKVISQSLRVLYKQLSDAHKRRHRKTGK